MRGSAAATLTDSGTQDSSHSFRRPIDACTPQGPQSRYVDLRVLSNNTWEFVILDVGLLPRNICWY